MAAIKMPPSGPAAAAPALQPSTDPSTLPSRLQRSLAKFLLQTAAQCYKNAALLLRRRGGTATYAVLLATMVLFLWGLDSQVRKDRAPNTGGIALTLHPCLEAVDAYDRVHATDDCAVLAYSAPTPAALGFAADVMAR